MKIGYHQTAKRMSLITVVFLVTIASFTLGREGIVWIYFFSIMISDNFFLYRHQDKIEKIFSNFIIGIGLMFFFIGTFLDLNFSEVTDLNRMSIIQIGVFNAVYSLVVVYRFFSLSYEENNKFRKSKEEQAKKAIIEKNEKVNLIRIISHDIATPITILKNSLKKIEKELPIDSIHYRRMTNSLRALTVIVDEVRDLEAISSGKKEFILEKIDIYVVLTELLELHHLSIEKKKISLLFDKGNDCYFVFADHAGLTYQVLNNLITNAIKFSLIGGTISILLESDSQYTKCSIKDNGIGIPDELLENIFNSSVKTTRLGTSGERGTGFGMPLVKSYMDKFKGQIEIETIDKLKDSINHGTTIRIIFPTIT